MKKIIILTLMFFSLYGYSQKLTGIVVDENN